MQPMGDIVVAPFEPARMSDARLAELTGLENAVAAERFPGDAARPPSYYRAFYAEQAAAAEFGFSNWWALRNDHLVGRAVTMVRRTGDNAHGAHVGLMVAPGARRRGIGRRLLSEALGAMRAEGRTHVTGTVIGPEPTTELPGSRFALQVGATPGLVERYYRLLLDHLDRDTLQRWQQEGARRSPEVELVWRVEPFRDEEVPEVARLMRATVNDAPRDALDEEDWEITPDSVRELDRVSFSLGPGRIALLARDRARDRLVGYTVLEGDPVNAHVLWQWDTGVEPAARGRGLARWLKAEMLARVLRELPECHEVRASNADSNAAILSINHRLGFRPWVAECTWQMPVDP